MKSQERGCRAKHWASHLATWEVEIWRITVKAQLGQKIKETPLIPVTWEVEIGGLWTKDYPGKILRYYLKNKNKKFGGVAQEIEHVPNNCVALS